MAAYKGFTEAQAKAHKKYMESVATIQIRTTPERRDFIKAHAERQGESINVFVNRAIDELIERERIESARNAERLKTQDPEAYLNYLLEQGYSAGSQLVQSFARANALTHALNAGAGTRGGMECTAGSQVAPEAKSE